MLVAAHAFLLLPLFLSCGVPEYGTTDFGQFLDPVGMALTTAHDVRVRHFGLEKFHSIFVPGQCPDAPAPGGLAGGRKWRQRAATHAIRPYAIMLLMLCGDVSSNPGPRQWKYPCGSCAKPVMRNQEGIQCDLCESWYHLNCLPDAIHISTHEYTHPLIDHRRRLGLLALSTSTVL